MERDLFLIDFSEQLPFAKRVEWTYSAHPARVYQWENLLHSGKSQGGDAIVQTASENTDLFWPLLVYAGIVFSLVGLILGASYILGQHHKDRATNEPYEGGILSTGSARVRFSSQFYMIAMLFVIFDVETVFIFSWAIAFRELGWYGYVGVLVFILLLVVVLVYEWRNGALDFGPDGKKILKAYQKLIKQTTTT